MARKREGAHRQKRDHRPARIRRGTAAMTMNRITRSKMLSISRSIGHGSCWPDDIRNFGAALFLSEHGSKITTFNYYEAG
jgi:hypothetical protein